MGRRGKIARMNHGVRQSLNRRLRDGEGGLCCRRNWRGRQRHCCRGGICAGAMEAVEGGGGDGECTSVRGLLGPAAAVAEPQGAGAMADHQGAAMMDN